MLKQRGFGVVFDYLAHVLSGPKGRARVFSERLVHTNYVNYWFKPNSRPELIQLVSQISR